MVTKFPVASGYQSRVPRLPVPCSGPVDFDATFDDIMAARRKPMRGAAAAGAPETKDSDSEPETTAPEPQRVGHRSKDTVVAIFHDGGRAGLCFTLCYCLGAELVVWTCRHKSLWSPRPAHPSCRQ